MSKVSYPRRKVFFAFFFCPLILGLIVGVVKFVALLVHLASYAQLMGEVRGTELVLMPIAAPLIAQVVFLLPFLGFAALIAINKIHRTTRNCVVISLTGGGLTMLWMLLFLAAAVHGVKNAQFADYILEMIIVFATSTITCWLTARFFLPEMNVIKR